MAIGHIQGSKQALPDDLESILNELDRTDQQVRQLVSDLSEAQLNWPPGATAWSIAQCLDHLGQTNSVYTAALRDGVRRAGTSSQALRNPIRLHLHPDPDLHPGWFGRWFIADMEPPPRRKFRSPKQIRPRAHRSGQEVLSAFIAAHDDLRSLIHEAYTLDLNRIRFKNPFIGWLRFTVATGMLIISAHDRRHLWQAQQVRAAMKV
jgi:hypothetical protein